MIDIATETIITLEDAAKRLLVSKTSVYGWVTRGFKGVRLEAFRVGGCWRTSVEALQRFANAHTPGHAPSAVPGPTGPPYPQCEPRRRGSDSGRSKRPSGNSTR